MAMMTRVVGRHLGVVYVGCRGLGCGTQSGKELWAIVRNHYVPRHGDGMAAVVIAMLKQERKRALDAVAHGLPGNLAFYSLAVLQERQQLRKSIAIAGAIRRCWQMLIDDDDSSNSLTISRDAYKRFFSACAEELMPETAVDTAALEADWSADVGNGHEMDAAQFHRALFDLVDVWTNVVSEAGYVHSSTTQFTITLCSLMPSRTPFGRRWLGKRERCTQGHKM